MHGTFWPTPRQELLFDAALGDPSRATAAWRALAPTFDIDRLDVGSYPLLPLLYRRLRELRIDDPPMPRLKGVYRHTWSRNQVVLDGLSSVVQALRGVGIDSLVTSAAAAAIRYYTELGLRPVGELDVMVSPDAVSRAFEALESTSWRRAAAPAPSISLGHAASFGNARGLTCYVRTQLLPQSPLAANQVDLSQRSWEDSVEITIRDVPTYVCSPTDQLLQTLVLGARGNRLRNIQWLIDALMILRSCGTLIEWEWLFRRAQEQNAVVPVREALVYLKSRLDAPMPELPARQIGQMRASRRDALAYNVGGFGGRMLGDFPGTIAYYMRCIDAGPARTVLYLPRFLQRAWHLDHMWQVPLAVVAKTFRQALLGSTVGRDVRASRAGRTSERRSGH